MAAVTAVVAEMVMQFFAPHRRCHSQSMMLVVVVSVVVSLWRCLSEKTRPSCFAFGYSLVVVGGKKRKRKRMKSVFV